MDGIDRRIVEMLADNGRLSYAEMARQVGLSGPAVHERVGKLEAAGVITGYQAQVDPDAVGLGVTAFIGIVQSAESDMDDIVAALARTARGRGLPLRGRLGVVPDPGTGARHHRAGAAHRPAQPDPGGRVDPHHRSSCRPGGSGARSRCRPEEPA